MTETIEHKSSLGEELQRDPEYPVRSIQNAFHKLAKMDPSCQKKSSNTITYEIIYKKGSYLKDSHGKKIPIMDTNTPEATPTGSYYTADKKIIFKYHKQTNTITCCIEKQDVEEDNGRCAGDYATGSWFPLVSITIGTRKSKYLPPQIHYDSQIFSYDSEVGRRAIAELKGAFEFIKTQCKGSRYANKLARALT